MKLNKYGIRGVANNLINNYLMNRKQFVSLNGTYSETACINCGVPQGSILGPLLFILYVNDIYLVSNVTMPILFADDSSLFIQGKDIHAMTNMMNNELNSIYTNRLSLNINKTYCMLFNSNRNNSVHKFS